MRRLLGRGHARSPERDEAGAAAVLLLLLTPVLFGAAGLVIDGGRQLAAREQAADLAEQAARSGADHLDTSTLRSHGTLAGGALDIPAAQAAACRYVHVSDPTARCTATVSPGPAGQQVNVEVRTSTHTVLLGLVGVNRLHTRGTATATAVTGISTRLTPGGTP